MIKDIAEETPEPARPNAPPKMDAPAKPDMIPRTERPARDRPPLSLRLPRETIGIFEIIGYAIAWLGVMLVVYGLVSTMTSEVWLPLERSILPIAATLVLVAIVLNAATIYVLPENPGPLSPVSRYVTAPSVILLCAAGIFLVWYQGLPVSVILGFAVLGLAWALLRALPRRPSAW